MVISTAMPSKLILNLEFVDMLNDLRFGNLNKEAIATFKALHRPLVYNDGIQPTELCAYQ